MRPFLLRDQQAIHLRLGLHAYHLACTQFATGFRQLHTGLNDIPGNVGLFFLGFAYKIDRLGGAGADTQTTPDAPIRIQDCLLMVQMKGLHLTTLGAKPTPLACLGVEASPKGANDHTRRLGVALKAFEHTTATAAACAYEEGVPGVIRLEHQPSLLGSLQDL